jgi:hypothetical protein
MLCPFQCGMKQLPSRRIHSSEHHRSNLLHPTDTVLAVESAGEDLRGERVSPLPTPLLVPLDEGPNFKAFTKAVERSGEFLAKGNFRTVRWLCVNVQEYGTHDLFHLQPV